MKSLNTRIIQMHYAGKDVTEISKKFKVARSFVQQVLKEWL